MELKEFKITVLPLRAKLLNYARKLTDEPEDAEDAVQEVLLKLWNKRLELEQYRSIEAFAMTLTHNICIDMWRCKRNDTLSLDIVQAASPTGTPERLLGRTSKDTKRTKSPKSRDADRKPSAAICQEPGRK